MGVCDLLGLDGVEPIASLDDDAGGLIVDVALEEDRVAACHCGSTNLYRHGRRTMLFRDLPLQRRPTRLRITRQRYRCRECGATLLADVPGLDSLRDMTVRFREQIAKDAISRTFSDAAELNGLKESMVRRVFKEHARGRLAHYTFDLPRVLGMDEKHISGRPRFVVGDVEGRRLLDIQPSRQQADLIAYFNAFDGGWERVEIITQDMYWGYKVLNERFFKRATIVVDKFHVVRYANLAVESARKAVQAGLGKDDRIGLKRKSKLLMARAGNLDDRAQFDQRVLLRTYPLLGQAVVFKDWFYDIYLSQSVAEAEAAYKAWVELLPSELERHFKPILSFMHHRRWRPLVFNYFEHPYTNAYVEAVNGLIDQINRSGRGYDLATLRAKALLRYGDVQPLIDTVAFDLMGATPEERDLILSAGIGHGIDLSTFERDLAAAAF